MGTEGAGLENEGHHRRQSQHDLTEPQKKISVLRVGSIGYGKALVNVDKPYDPSEIGDHPCKKDPLEDSPPVEPPWKGDQPKRNPAPDKVDKSTVWTKHPAPDLSPESGQQAAESDHEDAEPPLFHDEHGNNEGYHKL
jgi:hypothetical protein